jgi:hypothetical protein
MGTGVATRDPSRELVVVSVRQLALMREQKIVPSERPQ